MAAKAQAESLVDLLDESVSGQLSSHDVERKRSRKRRVICGIVVVVLAVVAALLRLPSLGLAL